MTCCRGSDAMRGPGIALQGPVKLCKEASKRISSLAHRHPCSNVGVQVQRPSNKTAACLGDVLQIVFLFLI